MKSILNTLDVLLGHLVAGGMTLVLYFCLAVVAIVSLVAIPGTFFEYASGISDLDLSEIGVLLLLGLVTWRFFSRGKSQYWTPWQLICRFVHVVAVSVMVMAFILFGVMVRVLWMQGTLQLSDFARAQELVTFAANLIIIITVYAATPLPPVFNKGKGRDPVASAEPDMVDSVDDLNRTADNAGGVLSKLKSLNFPQNPWKNA
ncbi:hypothetical protein [Ferrimonas kyonanensis]|uniref:hypothetical protein n=1 Tax=Ferrimonas kyonanensis TaxID=364763 RepID=UPI000419C3AF|nr:hypothetical protein [Ferrimonas kyonanensis]